MQLVHVNHNQHNAVVLRQFHVTEVNFPTPNRAIPRQHGRFHLVAYVLVVFREQKITLGGVLGATCTIQVQRNRRIFGLL